MSRLHNRLENFLEKEITIKGWLYNKRSSGSIAFLEIRDGYGWFEGVVSKQEVGEEVWKAVEDITQESSLVATGNPGNIGC
jgi:asparaginyl-tRNA synthetase